MSTAMVDLSSLQQINFGGGQTGYFDPSSGTYFDSGGNTLSASDLAQYGSFTVGAPGSTPPAASGPPSTSTINGQGSGAALSGMSSLFSSIGAAITNATRPATISTPSGTLVYNPSSGGYTSAAAITAASAMNPLVLLLLGGVVIWLILREA